MQRDIGRSWAELTLNVISDVMSFFTLLTQRHLPQLTLRGQNVNLLSVLPHAVHGRSSEVVHDRERIEAVGLWATEHDADTVCQDYKQAFGQSLDSDDIASPLEAVSWWPRLVRITVQTVRSSVAVEVMALCDPQAALPVRHHSATFEWLSE